MCSRVCMRACANCVTITWCITFNVLLTITEHMKIHMAFDKLGFRHTSFEISVFKLSPEQAHV
jgi:hypothetical protein